MQSASPATARLSARVILHALGPGILLAGAAIGGSHIVASTKAGAMYGWQLLGILLAVNVAKYPFFLFGQKYTAATGMHLLQGYRKLGGFYLWVFVVLSLLVGMMNAAGVALISVTIGLNFLPGDTAQAIANAGLINPLTIGLMLVCGAILVIGHYRALERTAKVIVGLLALSTVAAVILMLWQGGTAPVEGVEPASPWNLAAIGFIVIFMGWMPAPIDISAWASMWMYARAKDEGRNATVREAMIDFHMGYVTTVVLAVFFLGLGALTIYGTGVEIPRTGIAFADLFISMYAQALGEWAAPLITLAAFTCMFSTTLTCLDGWPRSIAAGVITGLRWPEERQRRLQAGVLGLMILTAAIVLVGFIRQLGDLLDIAMILSFVTSPFFAFLNYRVMVSADVPEAHRPGLPMKLLALFGFSFLYGATLLFLVWYFFPEVFGLG